MYILPQPTKVTWLDGEFRLRYHTGIVIDAGICSEMAGYSYEYAKILQEEIAKDTGLSLEIRRERRNRGLEEAVTCDAKGNCADGGIIFLTCEKKEPCSEIKDGRDEAYSLQISKEGVVISADASAGLLYGVQTLRQICRQAGAVWPCVEIEDAPKIANRGLSYDVTRGRVPTLEELKRQADFCSFYKMNQIQLYVEHTYMFREFSEVWRYNTPLTAEDILELDAYCKKLHIELVPQLASFGHLYEVLCSKSYTHLCELEDADKEEYSLVGRMGHHTVDVSNEESFKMVTGRMEEFMGLFSTRYFNICADETFDLCKGRSKALGEEKGVKRVYLDFLKKLCEFLVDRGRIPMFWGDVLLEKPELLAELPEEAVLLNWEYGPNVTEHNVKTLSDAGVRNLYLCPGVQSWNHLINRHSDAYPNIAGMCRNAHKYHAQGVLNTEWGDLGHIAHPEFSSIGQIYGAAFSWSNVILDEAEINKAISRLQYGDTKEEVVSLFRDLADTECVNWWHAVQYKEEARKETKDRHLDRIVLVWGEETAEERLEKIEDSLKKNSLLIEKLYDKLAEVPGHAKADICAYILMGEGQKLLSMTGKVLYERSLNRRESYDGGELAVKLEYWLAQYSKLWRSVSKESELFRIVEVISWYADRLREDA